MKFFPFISQNDKMTNNGGKRKKKQTNKQVFQKQKPYKQKPLPLKIRNKCD